MKLASSVNRYCKQPEVWVKKRLKRFHRKVEIMANRKKIPDSDIALIHSKLAAGETFTAIGRTYGVAAWTVQKRLSITHPMGGRNISDIWNYVPDYIDAVRMLYNRYRYWTKDVNLFDIILDYAYSLTRNELNKIQQSERPFWKLYAIMRSKLFACYIKKTARISGCNVLVSQRLSP